jgi:tetratricopeptide (TPR) repeat protein
LLGVFLLAANMVAQQPPSATPQTPAAQPSPHIPHAKTKPEFDDFKAASATTGGAAMEAAADSFASKYPDSELRAELYLRAMHEYQTENQGPKSLAMAEMVLKLQPENPVALVITATALSDQLPDSRPHQQSDELIESKPDPSIAEIKKNASLALQTIDTSFIPPAGTAPQQVDRIKAMLKAMAHSALGVTDLKTGDDAGAETELKAAADLNKLRPDPYVWYQLALAQDRQKKYAEALASVNEGLRYASSDPDLAKTLQTERDRLMKLTSGGQPAK